MKKTQVGGATHYDRPVQHVDVMFKNQFGYLDSQAMKYIWRHENKNGSEDIAKAIHYLLFTLKFKYEEIDDETITNILAILDTSRKPQ